MNPRELFSDRYFQIIADGNFADWPGFVRLMDDRDPWLVQSEPDDEMTTVSEILASE